MRDRCAKGSNIPYLAHPFALALILECAGFDEDVVIAGLLHDLVEDTDVTLDEIRVSFGDAVAETVAACSEIKLDSTGQKRPWADRKRDHLQALETASLAAKAVTLADKVNNLTAIAMDLDEGRDVWPTFNAPRDDVLAYYRAMIATCRRGDSRLEDLARQAITMLDATERLSRRDQENPPGPPLPS